MNLLESNHKKSRQIEGDN